MPTDALSKTLHVLYAAAADGALWPDALHAIEELTGSVGAVIDFVPKSGEAPRTVAGRFTLEQCSEYARNYQPICRRIGYGLENPHTIHCDLMILSEAEMDRDPVYNWLVGHGLRYFVGARVADVERHHVYFSLQRSPAQGHVQSGDLRLFALLRSHVGQAVSISDRLGTLDTRWRFGRWLFDSLPHAMFALAADGRILFANAADERLLAECDGLTSLDRRLAARLPSERGSFDRLLVQAAGLDAAAPAGGWTRLPRRSGRVPYLVLVAPLVLPDSAPSGVAPRIAVLVHDPAGRDEPCAEALRQLFGLTRAEVRVACALAQGHDLASAAACLNVSIGTIRSHLKAVFRKTGVNRQQDLIHMLTSLAQTPMARSAPLIPHGAAPASPFP